MSYNMLAELGDWKVHRYLRELNLRALNHLESHCPQASTGSLPKHAKSLIIFDPFYYPLFWFHSCEDKSVRFCPSIESIVPSSSI